VIAPHECLSCGMEGRIICGMCLESEVGNMPSRCYRCLAATKDSAVCKSCQRSSPFKHVWVVSEYEGKAKELVRLLKFERTRAAHVPIADALNQALPYFKEIIVTHVPTATSRERARGY